MIRKLYSAIKQHDIVQLVELLSAGVNLHTDDPDQPNWSALMVAVDEIDEGGAIDVVILLLRQGAPLNPPSDTPMGTPLTVAVQNKQLEAARILLAAGADPNVRTDEGDSPLRLSVEQENYSMSSLLLLC